MMHSANELRSTGQILAADGTTVKATVRVGVTDLSGRLLEQAQLINSQIANVIVARYADVAGILDASCYIVSEGKTYIVDYMLDPRKPRAYTWLEIFCHVEGLLTVPVLASIVTNAVLMENGSDYLAMEDGSSLVILET